MYKDYNDYELLYLINDSNEEAGNVLYDKYKPIIEMKAKKYKLLGKKVGLEYNDLFQEGMVGLTEAINSYKDNKDTKFASFANICIERQILSVLATARRKKHSLLNDSYSLDASIDEEGSTLLDFILGDSIDPSIKVENDEEMESIYNNVYKELSDFEKSVFDLKMMGLEYKEIASLLDKSYKSVDTAIQRIRFKLKKLLNK